MSTTAPVPPQNLEADELVLGPMMLAPGAIDDSSEVLAASDFYPESHATIYRVALALHDKGEPVDAITLTDELEQPDQLDDVGGRVRLHELAALVPASENGDHYAKIFARQAQRRKLIQAGDLKREGRSQQEREACGTGPRLRVPVPQTRKEKNSTRNLVSVPTS
jgi:replicative DNA helicase